MIQECEACNGEGTVCRPDGTGGWEQRACPACDGTGDVPPPPCERCEQRPATDEDSGLCTECAAYNDGRVSL